MSHPLLALVLALLPSALPGALPGSLNTSAKLLDREKGLVQVDLSWSNAWFNDRNHDAIWLTLRDASNGAAGVLEMAQEGHSLIDEALPLRILPSADGLGVFVELTQQFRGDLSTSIQLQLEKKGSDLPEQLAAWAVEMVFIPGGGFELGDDHPGVINKGGFYAVGEGGSPAGPFKVSDESAIEVAETAGALYYQVGRNAEYIGDREGPIPASFPKGSAAFYVMKYELRQGEYARFLRSLPEADVSARMLENLEGKEADTCSISQGDDGIRAAAPERPCNYLSWDDSSAWTDYLALRPLTEFEFEKAARGPERPMAGDFPWGNASREGVERIVEKTRDLALASSADEATLMDETKVRLAASHYWVMDLSGSVWERVISAGNPEGRSYVGTHGDGVLADGFADTEGWPKLGADGQEAAGIGYRGGAEYFGGTPNETNPFSCVGTRQYGAWAGGFRYKTYSARACRTAPAGARK